MAHPATVRGNATLTRPKSHPDGFTHVLLDGVFTVRDGERTLNNPGKVIRALR